MLFILLFCVFFLQPHSLCSASVAFNPISNTHQSTKNTSSVFNGTDQNENKRTNKNEFEFADDEDEFITLKNKNSFRTKLVRTMRSIKKHGAMIITAVTVCAVVYAYWYNIWPFSARLAPIIVKDENDTEEQIAEYRERDTEEQIAEYRERIETPIDNIEKISDQKRAQEILPSQKNTSQITNQSVYEELNKISSEYSQSDSSKKLDEKFELLKNKHLK